MYYMCYLPRESKIPSKKVHQITHAYGRECICLVNVLPFLLETSLCLQKTSFSADYLDMFTSFSPCTSCCLTSSVLQGAASE